LQTTTTIATTTTVTTTTAMTTTVTQLPLRCRAPKILTTSVTPVTTAATAQK
jgi:hypothetical protein